MLKKSRIRRAIILTAMSMSFANMLAFGAVSEEFAQKIRNLKWIAYSPTNFDPDKFIYPTEDSIREDLLTLYECGFRGIVTYGAYGVLAQIPRIAAETGFRGMIMGIWDISDFEELSNAIASSNLVDGYCAGNEGLGKRYESALLVQVMKEIREETGRPVTTTEEINDYYNVTLNLVSLGDWVFPNIHPFMHQIKDPEKAVRWIGRHNRLLNKQVDYGKIVFIKETGFPTSGAAGATETNQKVFFEILLEVTDISFVYFEAFDQPWKTWHCFEPHWGLFDQLRKPKKFAATLLY